MLFVCLLAASVLPAAAQKFSNWRVFKASDGLAESFVSSVSVNQRSNVWVWHSEINAISLLDGYRVKTFPAPHSGNAHVYESRVGQIWAPAPDGLKELKGGVWVSYPIREIQQEFQTNLVRYARSLSLVPLKHGHVLFLLSDRLMEFDNEWGPQARATTVLQASQTGLEKFYDMTAAPDGSIWLAGEKGILKLTLRSRGAPTSESFVPPSEFQVHDLQHPFADDGGVTVVGEQLSTRRRVAVHFDGSRWKLLPAIHENLRQAWRGIDGSFWAISINALYFCPPNREQFVESEEISAGNYFDVAVEPNGVFWLATSEGLFRYAPLLWRTPDAPRPLSSLILGICENSEGDVWFATPGALTALHGDAWKTQPLPEPIEKHLSASETIFPLRGGSIAVDMIGRLLQFDFTHGSFNSPAPAEQPLKPLGTLKDGSLVVQMFDPKSDSRYWRLEVFDGQKFQNFSEPAPHVPEGAELFFLFTAANGDVWLSTSAGVTVLREKKWRFFPPGDAVPDVLFCLADVGDGKIWGGSRDRLWEFDGQNWTLVRGGFDRVNSLLKSRDGSIWVASNSGLYRSNKGTWLLNSMDEGLPGPAVTKVFEDRKGRVWAATPRGIALYQPGADTDPPKTFIVSQNVSTDGSATIVFGGKDKWKGTPAEHLLFSWRLDEKEWSPYEFQREASFADLSSGKHYFQVRAMDRNWNIDSAPLALNFEIPLPWYKETRLVLISFAGLGGVVFFAALAFNRHRRLLRSYAEVGRIVALRTKQLEEANAQLLHSQKMTALGTLSAGIAHDFNNILSIIKGSVQIIESHPDDREKIQTRVERIKTVVDQGSGIIKAMLGFSRPSEKQLATCNINSVAEETIQLLGDRFLREIEVKFEPEKNLPEIPLAKDFVQQILLNFIFNAADATNGPGQIILRTGAFEQLPSHVVLPPVSAPAYIFVSVKDFGCGIAPEVMPRIFEPFFTTKSFSSRRGTGLGLSMVYQMAKEMGCGLLVESEVGKGSTFTVVLPVRKDTSFSNPAS